MKAVIVFLFICTCTIPYEECIGQSNLQFDLDHVVHISGANLLHEVKFLKVGKFIELTYWENGCGPAGPLRRNLRIERNPSFYTIDFCELKKNMTNDELWPIIDDFSKSLLTMDPKDACTTTKKIVIQNNFTFYLGIDGSCKWKGFTYLTLSIFNVLPHEPVDKICLKDW